MIHALVGCALILSTPVAAPNIYGLAAFRGRTYAATLDDGMLCRIDADWRQFAPPLSDPRPRAMVPFRGDLWVQNAAGTIDRVLPGGSVRLDQGLLLGRRDVHCLSTDGRVLLAGQWGGWSEFDGKSWRRFLDLPALQGYIVTALAANDRRIYIGTQGAGLGAYDRLNGTFKWLDRGLRLQDDWITCLALRDDDLFVGTFVGGLSLVRENGIAHFSETGRRQITCLLPEAGALWVGTRFGLLKIEGEAVQTIPTANGNIQALLRHDDGLWIGTSQGAFPVK